MDQSTSFYNVPYSYNYNNTDSRQTLEPFSEQESSSGTDPAITDLQQSLSYGLSSSIQPLALNESESKHIARGHDAAALNYMPGMPLSQQLPAQRYASGGSAFGAPEAHYNLQAQHQSLHEAYLVDTHGSCNFGNLPKPSSSNFPNYLDAHLPRPPEARTLPSTLASPAGVPPGSSSSATLSPISPSLGHPPHDTFSSPLGTFPGHDLAGHHHLNEFPPSPRSHFLQMSGSRSTLSGPYTGYSNSMDMETASNSSRGGSESLPFQNTKISTPICDGRQRSVHPEIHAKIDKGFFQAEGDWTCYRRNYFAVACSYKLKLENGAGDASGPFYLRNKQNRAVDKFAMCIAACIDNDETKSIELVQHTPKRDKGPQTTPEKKILHPNPSGQLGSITSSSVGAYPPSSPFGAHPSEGGYYAGTASISSPPPPAPADELQSTTYERIQFKKATANNGKRRAAQQYFYILVELYAGYRKPSASGKPSIDPADFEWHKVAIRMSAQMVVRGRSPGHYSDATRPSSSMGPGMGGGDGGSTSFYGMGGMGHHPMGGSAYGPDRMYTSGGFAHGGGTYTNRNMMHMSDNLELVPSLSSCSTLDDSSVSNDGSASISTHSPYAVYGSGMSQVPGLMSPPFSLPPSGASLSTPRSQLMSSTPFFKGSPGPPAAECKADPLWQRRNEYQQRAYPGQRYENIVNRGSGYVHSNDPLLRERRTSWQAPMNDNGRTKCQPMPT